MSDFSDLCPLFNTGVYGEVVFPYVSLSAVSTTDEVGGYCFGRSVIVTGAYVAKHTNIPSSTDAFKVKLALAATFAATKTVFASYKISNTTTTQAVYKFNTMTQASNKTFGATDVLLISTDGCEANTKHQSIIVRYKEK